MSAEERREEILEAAMVEFAIGGLHGTSTEAIARRVGVSQPYLFRLYGTKKDLFLAAVRRGFDRVEQVFRTVAEANPDAPLEAMGRAYFRLLSRREALLLQMQAYAACGDPEVQAVVRQCFGRLYQDVQTMTGCSDEELLTFFKSGMFLNVAASLDLTSVLDQEWVRKCLLEPQ
ncbi:MAG TPA: TetR/AcrR family transcriptional regulator [Chloroflexota bacterium]